jgi:hypothetical protein
MSQIDDQKLAGDIGDFFKSQRIARDNKEPVIKPADIDDDKCHPALRQRAREWYASELMKRASLSESEQRFLAVEIGRHLRGE